MIAAMVNRSASNRGQLKQYGECYTLLFDDVMEYHPNQHAIDKVIGVSCQPVSIQEAPASRLMGARLPIVTSLWKWASHISSRFSPTGAGCFAF